MFIHNHLIFCFHFKFLLLLNLLAIYFINFIFNKKTFISKSDRKCYCAKGMGMEVGDERHQQPL